LNPAGPAAGLTVAPLAIPVTSAATPFSANAADVEGGGGGGCTDTPAVLETPPSAAVIVALVAEVQVPAVAVKPAEEEPAATFTEAGTLTTELLEDSETAAPEGAAALSVTVQVVDAPEATLPDAQLMEESVTAGGCEAGAVSATETAFELPLKAAVTVAVWFDGIVPAAALKPADAAPAGTVTEAGTASRALFEERATAAPPEGAAALSVTVQVVAAPEARLEAAHCSEESVAGWAAATSENVTDFEIPPREAVRIAV
jgi:hypothetical protein